MTRKEKNEFLCHKAGWVSFEAPRKDDLGFGESLVEAANLALEAQKLIQQKACQCTTK